MAYGKKTFLSGLAMGLTGKGNPTFAGSDVFGKGYITGAKLRDKRRLPAAFLYGRAAEDGEKPTVIYDGVEYVGAILPDIKTCWNGDVKERLPYCVAKMRDSSGSVSFYVCSEPMWLYGYWGSYPSTWYEYVRMPLDSLYRSVYRDKSSAAEPLYFYPDSDQVMDDEDGGPGITELSNDTVVWANYDVERYAVGGLVCAKSEPIPLYNLPKCRYSGSVAPDVETVWVDKETFPYAYMCFVPDYPNTPIWLYLSDAPLYYSAADDLCYFPAGCTVHHWTKNTYVDFWEVYNKNTYKKDTALGMPGGTPWGSSEYAPPCTNFWASADVINQDTGEVYHAATEPIPVYE